MPGGSSASEPSRMITGGWARTNSSAPKPDDPGRCDVHKDSLTQELTGWQSWSSLPGHSPRKFAWNSGMVVRTSQGRLAPALLSFDVFGTLVDTRTHSYAAFQSMLDDCGASGI